MAPYSMFPPASPAIASSPTHFFAPTYSEFPHSTQGSTYWCSYLTYYQYTAYILTGPKHAPHLLFRWTQPHLQLLFSLPRQDQARSRASTAAHQLHISPPWIGRNLETSKINMIFGINHLGIRRKSCTATNPYTVPSRSIRGINALELTRSLWRWATLLRNGPRMPLMPVIFPQFKTLKLHWYPRTVTYSPRSPKHWCNTYFNYSCQVSNHLIVYTAHGHRPSIASSVHLLDMPPGQKAQWERLKSTAVSLFLSLLVGSKRACVHKFILI